MMTNIFKFHTVQFSNGKYGSRRLTPWTQSSVMFDTKEEIQDRLQKVQKYIAAVVKVL